MRFSLILVALTVSAVGGVSGYPEWRANYEASLKAPDGWLSVARLSWLQGGANTVDVPSQKPIVLRLAEGKVFYEKRQLKSDITDHPDVLKFGEVSLTVIERGGKLGV